MACKVNAVGDFVTVEPLGFEGSEEPFDHSVGPRRHGLNVEPRMRVMWYRISIKGADYASLFA